MTEPTTASPADDPRAELAVLAAELRNHVIWMQDAGVRLVARPDAAPRPVLTRSPEAGRSRPAFLEPAAVRAPPRPPPAPAPGPAPTPRPVAPPPAAIASVARDSASLLRIVNDELGDCVRCHLSTTRRHLVFGEGRLDAELVFVGDGPGPDDDASGHPFQGRAGEQLDRMLAAMGFSRAEVYLCHIVKCRPAGERPQAPEIAKCRPFVEKQLRALRPKVIVTLGGVAAQTLLNVEKVGPLRGQWQKWEGIDLLPTYSPDFLLKAPGEKGKAWSDLKLVLARLGRAVPARE